MQPASLQLEPFPVIPSSAQLEAKVAMKRVEELKAMVGADAPSLKDITLKALEQSADLRSLILDYTMTHWEQQTDPKGSFKKQYASKAAKDLDME